MTRECPRPDRWKRPVSSERLSGGVGGQSTGMSSHDDRSVANPDRTHVDDDPTPHERDADVHETRETHDPHDQPWPAVAKKVKQAVDDGPLD
jgi:hypothetical protein